MVVEITIVIDVDEDDYNERELKQDIKEGFPERTGYEVEELLCVFK